MDSRHVEPPRKRQMMSPPEVVLSEITNKRTSTGAVNERKRIAHDVERGCYDHRKRHSWKSRQATLQSLNSFLGGSELQSPASSPEQDAKRSDFNDPDAGSRPSEPKKFENSLNWSSSTIRETDGRLPFSPQHTRRESGRRLSEDHSTSAEQEASGHADNIASPPQQHGQQCQPVTPSPSGINKGLLLRRCNYQPHLSHGNGIMSQRDHRIKSLRHVSVKSAATESVAWQVSGHLKPLASAILSPPPPTTTPSPWQTKPPRHPSLSPSLCPLISSILPATKKVVVKAERSPRINSASVSQEAQERSDKQGQEGVEGRRHAGAHCDSVHTAMPNQCAHSSGDYLQSSEDHCRDEGREHRRGGCSSDLLRGCDALRRSERNATEEALMIDPGDADLAKCSNKGIALADITNVLTVRDGEMPAGKVIGGNDDLVDHDGTDNGTAQRRKSAVSLDNFGRLHVRVKSDESQQVSVDPTNGCALLTCPSPPKVDNTRFVEAFAQAADKGRSEESTAATSAALERGVGDNVSLPHLQRLNPEQLAAATASPDRPLLVLAGPGSGKTSTMVARLLHFLHLGLPPSSLLAMTFTTAAVQEVRSRVRAAAGKQTSEQLGVSTFHSFCLQLCRQYADRLGRSPDFLVYGHKQQWRAVAEAVRLSSALASSHSLSHPLPASTDSITMHATASASKVCRDAATAAATAAAYTSAASLAAADAACSAHDEKGIATPTTAVAARGNDGCNSITVAHNSSSNDIGGGVSGLPGDADLKALTRRWHKAIQAAKSAGISAVELRARGNADTADMLERYEEVLKTCDAVDYADFILACTRLLREHEDVRETVLQQWSHVLVDEFQDTSLVQFQFVAALCVHGRITVVGDDDQSIFGFNGANAAAFGTFRSTFPDHTEVRLRLNYRSSSTIVAAASSLIRRNAAARRTDKGLYTTNAQGEKIRVVEIRSEAAQCAFITDTIASLIATPREPPPPHSHLPPAASVAVTTAAPVDAAAAVADCSDGTTVPPTCAAGGCGVRLPSAADAVDGSQMPAGAQQPVVLGAVVPPSLRSPTAAAVPAAAAAAMAAGCAPDNCYPIGLDVNDEAKLLVVTAAGAVADEADRGTARAHGGGVGAPACVTSPSPSPGRQGEGVRGRVSEGSSGARGEGLLQYRDIAILYRRQVTGKQLQAALRARRIPFNVHGVAFYRKKAVRHALALMEVGLPPVTATATATNKEAGTRKEEDTGKQADNGGMMSETRGHGGSPSAHLHHSVHDSATRKVWKLLFARHGSKEEAKQTADHIDRRARERHCSFLEAARQMFTGKVSGRFTRQQLRAGSQVLATVRIIRSLLTTEPSLSSFADAVVNFLPNRSTLSTKATTDEISGKLLNEDYDPRCVRQVLLDDIAAFLSLPHCHTSTMPGINTRSAGCEESLRNFLSHVAAREAQNFAERRRDNEDSITLTTMHQSKGLEWHTVFVVSCQDGEVPLINYHHHHHHQQQQQQGGAAATIRTDNGHGSHAGCGSCNPNGQDPASHEQPLSLEEERRLFYVAVTRACQRLILVCPQRSTHGQALTPSRFLFELPSHLLNWQGGSLDGLSHSRTHTHARNPHSHPHSLPGRSSLLPLVSREDDTSRGRRVEAEGCVSHQQHVSSLVSLNSVAMLALGGGEATAAAAVLPATGSAVPGDTPTDYAANEPDCGGIAAGAGSGVPWISTEANDLLLKRFPLEHRPAIASLFHHWAKQPAFQQPARLLAKVRAVLDSKHHRGRSSQGSKEAMRQLRSLLQHPDAQAFALHVIRWQQLPEAHRALHRAERQEAFQSNNSSRSMATAAPTEKQLQYLRQLGCTVTPTSKLHASKLIEQYKAM